MATILFLRKKPNNERERLIDSLSFKKGDVLFTMPTEKDGSLDTQKMGWILYGISRILSLELRKNDIRLIATGIKTFTIERDTYLIVLVVDVYTHIKKFVKIERLNLLVELSKRLDGDRYVFTVEHIGFLEGYPSLLDIFPPFHPIYIDEHIEKAIREKNLARTLSLSARQSMRHTK
ncbi:MAG: hypothetical protein QXJ23_09920 [Thermofilum sp.]|uniref:hypothetical protein n=1 Tax=Thermofilum sp. TaxID=1961369 RepID=UPI00317B4D40